MPNDSSNTGEGLFSVAGKVPVVTGGSRGIENRRMLRIAGVRYVRERRGVAWRAWPPRADAQRTLTDTED